MTKERKVENRKKHIGREKKNSLGKVMAELHNWQGIIVPQRHHTGCIPTGYEWLIRYLGIAGVNLETFQEDFDLGAVNNFVSVADKISATYRHVNIKTQSFSRGVQKVTAIRKLIEVGIPCLISLALLPVELGWHVMPIVCIDARTIRMVHHANGGMNHVWELPLDDVIWRHDNMCGGRDIAWIQI